MNLEIKKDLNEQNVWREYMNTCIRHQITEKYN